MSLLGVTIYLSCLMMSMVNGDSVVKQYCYDPTMQSCEKHILDCGEGQVISTDIASLSVSYYKNGDTPECQTGENECKNKRTCCRFISSDMTIVRSTYTADDNTQLINFIKTECSSKSSCIVSLYRTGSSKQYNYINYTYGCIPASKDNITVDFLVNGSITFTGNNFPTIYYLDYTGNGTEEDIDVIFNRECIVTTTEKDITVTIKTLNLQADDCCRFHISGYNVSDYCSQNDSFVPPMGKNIGNDPATVRLENVVNKDGDSFSILVKAAGDVTIDCKEIEHVDKQDNITVNFLVNGPTKFTGNRFPTVYYLDYTGNGTKDKDVILNRECTLTTTHYGISLAINELNLQTQAHECCRFHISGHKISEYCSQCGLFKHNKERCIGLNTAFIRLDSIVNKDGDSFSILVRAAGNLTINCITIIEHVNKQESTRCQYPATESSSIRCISMSSRMEDSETNLAGIIGGTVGGLVVLVVIIIVVVVIMRRRRQPKHKVDENNYCSTVDDNPKDNPEDNPQGNSNYAYIDIDLDKTIPNNSATQVKGSGDTDRNPKEVNKTHPIFKRQEFSFVEGKFGRNKENKDTGKPKGSNSKPSSNYNYTEIDLPQEDDYDDTYDHAQQGGDSILKQPDQKEQNASDTYNHIVTKNDNSVYSEAKAVPDTYNHIGVNNPVANSDLDTYNHTGTKKENFLSKEARAVSDNYNHIGVNNTVAKGDNSDIDTYNHIGVNNIVAKGDNSDLDTYNHIGVYNPVAKGGRAVPDTYNHIGVNNDNSVSKGDNSDLDTYNHIGVNNDNYVAKGDNSESDPYNHIGTKNENSVAKGDNSDLDTYNHIGVKNENSVSKEGNSTKPNQVLDKYEQPWC